MRPHEIVRGTLPVTCVQTAGETPENWSERRDRTLDPELGNAGLARLP